MRSFHRLSWTDVTRYLQQPGAPEVAAIAKHEIEHPLDAGMLRSLGLPLGQLADWRMPAPHCGGLHVREFVDRYTAHVDQVNPVCDLPGHMAADAPAIGGGAALGALVGLALGESAGAMLLGAVVGGLLGSAVAASAEASAQADGVKRRPVPT
jgi:hypothetical protein